MPPLLRYLWAAPASLPGLVLAGLALATRGRAGIVDGVLEVHGGAAEWVLRRCVPIRGGAQAMTLGHVVVGRTPVCLETTRTHERVHVRQAERWGPFFLPAYLLASGWAFVRGRDPYLDNPFEREAFATTCLPEQTA